MKRLFVHNAAAVQKQAGLLKMRLTTTYRTVIVCEENQKKLDQAEKLLNEAANILASIK